MIWAWAAGILAIGIAIWRYARFAQVLGLVTEQVRARIETAFPENFIENACRDHRNLGYLYGLTCLYVNEAAPQRTSQAKARSAQWVFRTLSPLEGRRLFAKSTQLILSADADFLSGLDIATDELSAT